MEIVLSCLYTYYLKVRSSKGGSISGCHSAYAPFIGEVMRIDELMDYERNKSVRKKPSDEEHKIQCACVRWFKLTHRNLAGLLYAVPNGGKRDQRTGAYLKAEGVLAGVSDLNLDVPNKDYHGLRIEMKTPKGKQQESQTTFQINVEKQGYKYAICRSLDDFIRVVETYLSKVE